MQDTLISLAYLVSSVLFILCLRGLSSPEQGRRGIFLGEIGMLIAVLATLVKREIVSYEWIVAGLLLGSLIGTSISLKIPMTKMPERIAFSHAFGGLATALVGVTEFHKLRGLFGAVASTAVDASAAVGTAGIAATEHAMSRLTMGALGFEVFLGSLTFTGSIMAFGKLQGVITGAPVTWKGQNAMNIGAFFGTIALLVYQVAFPNDAPQWMFFAMCGAGLALGVLAVLPIGGADMPVVISLLNSYAGLAACATGFALKSNILIICGALDGSSGLLLSMIMSKAMNRSFANVVFGAFGTAEGTAAPSTGGAAKPFNEATVEDAAAVLMASQSVIIVPGYGMAVSQAQHAVRDLAAALEKRGTEVKYAIHPVAGRMPGHMNVLLAEANVPYDSLFDLDMINDDFARTDAVLVVGANDVVNPGAKTDTASPIYGMPVFNVEQARSVIVLKRSMSTGFSGVENELFFLPNTMMVLGDAKKTILALVNDVKGVGGH
jgi:NAD(P) transhydrogenase subunit beta